MQEERGVRICERNSPAEPKVSAEGGQEVLQALEQRFSCSRGPARGGTGCVLAATEAHGGADPHPQPTEDPTLDQRLPRPHGKPTLEQAPARTCRPMERGAHAGVGLLAGLVTPWGPTLEQPVPEGLHPMGGTHAGAVHEELQPVGRIHVGAGKRVRRKERQRQRVMN